MSEKPDADHRRARFQFSLRALLLAFPFVAWCVGTGIRGAVLAAAVIGVVFLLIKRRYGLAFGVIAGFLFLSCLGLGNSVEVRLDTGDQRLLFWGVPIRYMRLRPELREALLSLDDPQVPRRWVWCATQVGSNAPDLMVHVFYREAAAWVEVDPEIARLVVRDIAKYVQTTHGTQGLPESNPMLFPDVVRREDGRYRVTKGWEEMPHVQSYLRSKGYVSRQQ